MNPVSRETTDRLDMLVKLVEAEAARQNLVSASTLPELRTRHVDDSIQLAELLPPGVLVDIGTGAGFPGMVLACVRPDPVHLIEPRARRARFLSDAAAALGLDHVTVWQCRVERVALPAAAAITARAVAPLDTLFAMAAHIADARTRWVLPKGRTANTELEAARRTWQGCFARVASRTDPDAAIIVASAVQPKGRA